MNLDQAEEEGTLVTRTIKIQGKKGKAAEAAIGRKLLCWVKEVIERKEKNTETGEEMVSTVALVDVEDCNFDVDGFKEGVKSHEVYLPGQLAYQIAQVQGDLEGNQEALVLITYTGTTKDVETKYGTSEVHNFTVKTVKTRKV
jgi:hypothetical protein